MNVNQTNAYMNPRLVGMRLPTSLYGRPIPVIQGTHRIAWCLLWYNDFTAESATQAQGGKGGVFGSAGKGQSYVYYSAIAALLCAGPVQQLGNVWDSQGVLLIQTGKTVVTVPSVGPYTVTVTPPGSGSYAADIGGARTDAYSVTVNDFGSPGSTTYAGNQQTPMQQVPSSPGPGQYSVVINPGPPQTGTYTFNSADAGKTITIAYAWQDPAAITNAKTNPGSVLDLTLFVGNQGQAAWGFVTTNYPSQARGYTLMAYVACPSLYLGPSGELPGFTFEVISRNAFGGGIVDTNPAVSLPDTLMDQEFGVGWTPADFDLGNIGGTLQNWSAYCVANGLFISLLLNAQESASSIVDRILQITNSEMICSGDVIKIITYGDTTAVGNGVTFTPNTSPVVDFDDDDYLTDKEPGENNDEDPIQLKIPTVLDAYNDVYVEYLNRANGYNPEILESKDDASIAQIGVRTMPSVSMHDITEQPVASLVASLLLQRSVNIRTQYTFKVGMQYRYLEPMDMVTTTDLGLDLNKTPVRILSIVEDEKWELSITAEEFPWGTATPTLYPKQPNGGTGLNTAASPPDVAPPLIFEANNRATAQFGQELWIGVCGSSPENWGGCHVWLSADGTTYKQIQDIYSNKAVSAPARMGVLTANLPSHSDPDTVNTLAVDIFTSGQTLQSGTMADADADRTICIVDNELISYETATLTGPGQYSLTYLRRGQLTSAIAAHTSGAPFLRLDSAVFRWAYDPTLIGQTVYLKFTSFNSVGQQEQSLGNVPAYSITIQGNYLGLLTGAHATYRPLSNPLTAHDAGSSATIFVAAFTMRVAGLDLPISSGSITGLSYNTLYYVYYDDPGIVGGTVTFQATTTKETAIGFAGRFYVGSITTPRAGAPDTVGNNDGGSGAQNGATDYLFMGSTIVSNAGANDSVTNASDFIDGNLTTFATMQQVQPVGGVNGCNLQAIGPPGLQRKYSSLTLFILVGPCTNTYNTGVPTIVISYTVNGVQTILYSGTTFGTLQTFSAVLPQGTNPAQVQANIGLVSTNSGTGTVTVKAVEAYMIGVE